MYAAISTNWFKYAELELPSLSRKSRFLATKSITFTPQNYPEDDLEYFLSFKDTPKQNKDKNKVKHFYDLKTLSLLSYDHNKIELTELGKAIIEDDVSTIKQILAKEALKTDKIRIAYQFLVNNPKIPGKTMKLALKNHLLSDIKSKVYKDKSARCLYNWAKFILTNQVSGKTN